MNKLVDQLSTREIEILRLISEGASDREIASKLYLSINTIKWHNRQIYNKLGVSSRTQAAALAAEAGLLEDQPSSRDTLLSKLKNNLPIQISSFVGRQQEIDDIKALLKSTRLLTLTGPGGVGKTRLALQVAAQLSDENRFPHGIFLIELAPITKPERVAETIVNGLGLISSTGKSSSELLNDFLFDKSILLVIDNFEHLLEAGSLILELLTTAPGLTVFTTSREALNLSGEQIYPVLPLLLPDLTEDISSSTLLDCESIDLFFQRVKTIKPDFNPTDEDLVLVAEICNRLDGLPLAIELAAAQIRYFNLNTLIKQIEDRFSVLTIAPRDAPEKHQSLQKAIDWSYELLDDVHRTFFNRLSVFQDGGTIDAIGAICCHDLPINVLDSLVSLLSKNLIKQEEGLDFEPRFFMLETIHEYTFQRLFESGDLENTNLRHAQYFTELAERGKYLTRGGPDQALWLNRLRSDYANLRAMFEWSIEGEDFILGLRLVGTLEYFWLRTGSFDDGMKWVLIALEVIDGVAPEIKAAVYSTAGMMYYLFHQPDISKSMYLESLDIYLGLGDKRAAGWVHTRLMDALKISQEERFELREHFDQAVRLFQEIGDQVGIAQALNILALNEQVAKNFSKAREAYEQSLVIAREIGDGMRESINLRNMARIHLNEGDPESSQKLLKKSLQLELALNHSPLNAAMSLLELAGPALRLDQLQRAVILLGASQALFLRGAFRPQPEQEPAFQEYQSSARDQLDQETFQKYWEKGLAMNPEEAIAFALE